MVILLTFFFFRKMSRVQIPETQWGYVPAQSPMCIDARWHGSVYLSLPKKVFSSLLQYFMYASIIFSISSHFRDFNQNMATFSSLFLFPFLDYNFLTNYLPAYKYLLFFLLIRKLLLLSGRCIIPWYLHFLCKLRNAHLCYFFFTR